MADSRPLARPLAAAAAPVSPTALARASRTPARGWQHGIPLLTNGHAAVRELRPADAVDLFQAMSRADVTRFISPPPVTIRGFEEFIAWAERERLAGAHVCLAILGPGTDTTVGLIQIRALEGGFRVAEWGFALAPEFWGTGLFMQCARLALQFAFTALGVHRLEARAVIRNARGNAVLRKLGAIQEGVLRRAFFRHGQYMDQMLWSILADDWLHGRPRANVTAFH